jgi:hypothetical protein
VFHELRLIDIEAKIQKDEDPDTFAEREKDQFLALMRQGLEENLRHIAGMRSGNWHLVESTFFKEQGDPNGKTVGTLCPPGFTEIDGICVPNAKSGSS